MTNPEKIVCIRKRLADFDIVFVETDFAGYQELIKKLKLEYPRKARNATLWKGFAMSRTNIGESRKNSNFRKSYFCEIFYNFILQ